MAIKKSLYIIFGILTLLISLEVGFYLGVNFTKNQKETIPTSPEKVDVSEEKDTKTKSFVSAYHPEVLSPERIKAAQSLPAWYVKESYLFHHFKGRVKKIDWKENEGIIEVENINDASEVYTDRLWTHLLGETPVVLKENSTGKEIPIKKEDIQPGDILSVSDKVDLLNNKLTYLKIVVERTKQ